GLRNAERSMQKRGEAVTDSVAGTGQDLGFITLAPEALGSADRSRSRWGYGKDARGALVPVAAVASAWQPAAPFAAEALPSLRTLDRCAWRGVPFPTVDDLVKTVHKNESISSDQSRTSMS